MSTKSQTKEGRGGNDIAPAMSTQGEQTTPPLVAEIKTSATPVREDPKIPSGDIVEIEVITAHDGLEVGYTKRVQRYSALTIHMLECGYWKVK